MAVVNEIPSIASGVVNTANGVFMVNDLSDNDPRKAPVFDSKADALAKLDAHPSFSRVEGLVLKAKLNGKTVQYVFDGGITDDDFVLFRGSSKSQIKPLQVFDNENIVTILNSTNAFTLDNPENTLIKSVFTDSVTSLPIEIRLYHIITEPILPQYNILPGAFGTGGQTFHSSNLELSNTVNLTGEDIEELEDTVTYEYDTGAVNVVDYINALDPSIVVANPSTNLTIFKITTNGVLTDYLYKGSGATYGLNDNPIDIVDLQILEAESESVSNVTEKVITVSLLDIGATSFDDDVPTKIKAYAIAQNITKQTNELHRWKILEKSPFLLNANGVTIELRDGYPAGTTGLAEGDASGTVYTAYDQTMWEAVTGANFDSGIDFTSVCTTLVTDMDNAFNANSINSNSFNEDITHFDTSNVTTMFALFQEQELFNQDISFWDVSNVENMGYLLFNSFFTPGVFNQDLSSWCVEQIQSEPFNFDNFQNNWVLPKPNWGAPC